VTRRPRFTSSLTSQALRQARPSPGDRPAREHLAVVALQVAADLHRHELALLLEDPLVGDAVLGARHQAVVAREVGERLGLAGALEVGGRAAHHAVVARELGGDQVGALQVGDADREVEALVLQVHQPLRQVQRDVQVGMLGDERRKVRRDVLAAERGRGGDDQPARGALRAGGKRVLGAAQLREDAVTILVERRPSGVSVTLRVERLKSFTASRSSSWSMRLPTIAGVMPSSRAAAKGCRVAPPRRRSSAP
jgi:hypothetical protein